MISRLYLQTQWIFNPVKTFSKMSGHPILSNDDDLEFLSEQMAFSKTQPSAKVVRIDGICVVIVEHRTFCSQNFYTHTHTHTLSLQFFFSYIFI
jgi:hypothetical protein